MADKSFEQQVQENLAGLRMKPDMAVWVEVERALHKERKRRWLIWVVLLAAAGGASFWAYENFSAKTPEPQITTSNTIKTSIEPIQKEKNTAIVDEKIEDKKEVPPFANNNQSLSTEIKSNRGVPASNTQKNKTPKPQVATPLESITAESNTTAKPSDQEKPDVVTPVRNEQKKIEPAVADLAVQPVTNIDTPHIPTEIKHAEEIPPVKTDSIFTGQQQSVVKINKKNPWQWNINVDAGKSGLRSGPTFGQKSLERAVAGPGTGNPSNGLTGPGIPGNPGNAVPGSSNLPVTVAPTIKDAFSFGLQMEATKKIGKKSSLGLSAGYLLMQTKTGVGQRIDSTAFFSLYQVSNRNGYYYSSTDSVDYTNQYHFLQLGANYYIPFRLFKAVSFRWQLGMGLDFLIATNGLHYDPVNGRLFENSSLFTKTQLYTSTGLDLAIGKQPFLYIGPHWLYSFNTLSEQGINNKHLTRFAVQASFVLPKKKK
jgi:hypothetical protein